MGAAKLKRTTKDKGFSTSKKLFYSILNAIPDLVSVIDKDFRIVFSNWRGGYEYVPRDHRKKRLHCYDTYYGSEKCEPCHMEDVFRTGEPFITEKFNPKVGNVEIHAFPIFDDAGNVIMAGEYHRNITARK